ncbi:MULTISPECIES: SIR2 family protein [unclassified Lysinibacillus]|uniref:SIR2 family protein n=1 Tax=unclassified Lysinibacillus TaxID=2636778 RepID=UPI0037F9B14E
MGAFIKESKRVIRDAINNNKLIIFVGAGVSANSGLPSWWDLVEKFTDGLGIDTESITQDDFLKIPQYYYNERGNKEYYDIINKVFNVSVKSNPIHSLLLELQPSHFITTNYDELIEDAAREKGIFFDVVSKDEDLPFTPNNNMIIKMHGDLKNKNIVLKEDDYLSYSNEFKLIEHYIKALLSTHVILFVGYSLKDYNVKLIFQWVKDILKKDFQPAYFLNIDEKPDVDLLEFHYYRNRGLNILNYSDLEKEPEYTFLDCTELTNIKGKKTYSFLNYLKKPNEYKELDLEYFYSKLKEFDQLNRVRFKDIKRALDIEFSYRIERHFLILHDDLLKPFITDLISIEENQEENEINKNHKYNIVCDIFRKAKIEGFKIQGKENDDFLYEFKQSKSINFKNDDQFIKLILEFDYIGLKEWTEEISDGVVIEGNEILFLQKAFALYKTQNFYEAYKLLKRISDSTFFNKNYMLYFISEFNRENIGKLISTNIFIYINETLRNEIRNEVKKIDLENIYLNLPKVSRKNIEFLREINNFNYIYSTIYKVANLSKKVEEEMNTVFVGLPKEGKIHELQNEVEFFWEYINYNFLMVENFTEVHEIYKYYIEGTLKSILFSEDTIDKNTLFGIEGEIIKLNELDYFSFYLMVSFFKSKELKSLFKKLDVEIIPIRNEDCNYIISNFINLINSKYSNANSEVNNKIDNILIILSKINVGKAEFKLIIENMIRLINSKKVTEDNIVNFGNLIVSVYNQFKENLDVESLDELLNSLLRKIIEDNKISNSNRFNQIIDNIVNIIKSLNPKYISDNLQLINILTVGLDFSNRPLKGVIISVFKILNSNLKVKVRRAINKKLKQEFCMELYHDALMEGVIKRNSEYEELLIIEIDKIIERNKFKTIYSFPDPIDRVLEMTVNLLINNLLINPALFSKYKGLNDKFDLFIDINNFDFEKFKFEWISEFSDRIHEKISKVSVARDVIKEKFKKLIMEGNISKESKIIYFKYYD